MVTGTIVGSDTWEKWWMSHKLFYVWDFPPSNTVHHSSFIGTWHSSSTIFRFVD